MQQVKQALFDAKRKSYSSALMLTGLLGPLGLLYASVVGGLIMCVAAVILAGAGGLGLALIAWPVSMFWAAGSVGEHNNKLRAEIEFQAAVGRQG